MGAHGPQGHCLGSGALLWGWEAGGVGGLLRGGGGGGQWSKRDFVGGGGVGGH